MWLEVLSSIVIFFYFSKCKQYIYREKKIADATNKSQLKAGREKNRYVYMYDFSASDDALQ